MGILGIQNAGENEMIYNVTNDLDEVKTDLLGNLTKHLDVGLERIGKAIEGKNSKYVRADFHTNSESKQNAQIKYLIDVEKLTQEQVADLVGIDQSTVSRRYNAR